MVVQPMSGKALFVSLNCTGATTINGQSKYRYLNSRTMIQSVFNHMASNYANCLEQEKVFTCTLGESSATTDTSLSTESKKRMSSALVDKPEFAFHILSLRLCQK